MGKGGEAAERCQIRLANGYRQQMELCNPVRQPRPVAHVLVTGGADGPNAPAQLRRNRFELLASKDPHGQFHHKATATNHTAIHCAGKCVGVDGLFGRPFQLQAQWGAMGAVSAFPSLCHGIHGVPQGTQSLLRTAGKQLQPGDEDENGGGSGVGGARGGWRG